MKKFLKKTAAVLAAAVAAAALVPAAVLPASACSFLLGDVDLSSSIDSGDALLAIRSSLDLAELDEQQKVLADVNLDDAVNSSDALAILQFAVGAGGFEAIVSVDFSSVKETLTANICSFEDEIVKYVNEEREARGLPLLEKDDSLFAVADERVTEMGDVCNHTRPDGRSWSSALTDLDIPFLTCGENVAGGFKTPKEVFDAWMNSEGHRRNILSPDYNRIGVGYAFLQDSRYGYYWEQVFTQVSEQLNDESSSINKLLDSINEERAKKGLCALTADESLAGIAAVRAGDIAEKFDMKRPDGSAWAELLDKFGADYTTASQLICCGQQEGADVCTYYMDKYKADGSVPKFLDESKNYKKIGIGHEFVDGDEYGHYWTIILTD